jgi:hypothetical protein
VIDWELLLGAAIILARAAGIGMKAQSAGR